MTTENLTEILEELRKPFHPSQVTWRPGAVNPEGSKALGLAYADLRAYQNRLDEVCGLDWSVSYTPWGERIICHLTIRGITRSSTGEPDSQAERSEIAGTATEAQAFKRACAMFGLGRYLYMMPSIWVEYNRESRYFTERGKARLEAIVANHYRRWQESDGSSPDPVEGNDSAVGGQSRAAPTAEGENTANSPSPEPVEGEPVEAKPAGEASTAVQATDASGELREEFDRLGQRIYGVQWAQVSQHNIERISAGQANSSAQLTAEQIQRLIDGLKSLQRSRAQKAPESTTSPRNHRAAPAAATH
ncbi:MAG TPA: hypothetical protein PKE45_12100 [Caldilineaceae bacterium]|nr:hypothetical protein [Caldilineaceae bacterium]